MTIPIPSFPKIFAIGQRHIQDIFDSEVEITEKIDGSQFSFGKIDGELIVRSKGCQLYVDNPEEMFKEGIEYIVSIQAMLPDNTVFYSEYLKKPKHNVLAYDRIPKNHLMLFGAMDLRSQRFCHYDGLSSWAKKHDIEIVPRLFEGKIEKPEDIFELIEIGSVLGGQKVEGVVVKNYSKPFVIGGQIINVMSGKYVSEKFKEVANKEWKRDNTGKGQWEMFLTKYKSEARWNKAIQHLRETGILEESPRDIGNLLKEIQVDIVKEEGDEIKEFLWKHFHKEVLRYAIKGFPEYYKELLLKESIGRE